MLTFIAALVLTLTHGGGRQAAQPAPQPLVIDGRWRGSGLRIRSPVT